MKRSTMLARLTRVPKSEVNKTSRAYEFVKAIADGSNNGNIIRPCYTTGAGRFIKNSDHTATTVDILRRLRVKFIVGNDAPRGGLTGNYIKILHLDK